MTNQIGLINEGSLHATLKQWYKEPNDQLETQIDNFVIDIVRDNLLIEIQTKNFTAIRRKLQNLIKNHQVRLVHPIIKDKWIISIDVQSNSPINKRLSPKHSSYIDIFEELIRIPDFISDPNFTIEILLVQIEEIRRNNGNGSWRRKGWSICDKRLLKVLERKEFYTPVDFLMLKPSNMKTPFTNAELAHSLEKPLKFAQKMSYCLRKMGLFKVVGKQGKSLIFDY